MKNQHGQEERHREQQRSTKANDRVLQRTNHVADLQKCAQHIPNSTNKRHYCCPETDLIEEFGLRCHHNSLKHSHSNRSCSASNTVRVSEKFRQEYFSDVKVEFLI